MSNPGADTPSTMLKRADFALYAAKRNGRNCVETEPGSSGEPPPGMDSLAAEAKASGAGEVDDSLVETVLGHLFETFKDTDPDPQDLAEDELPCFTPDTLDLNDRPRERQPLLVCGAHNARFARTQGPGADWLVTWEAFVNQMASCPGAVPWAVCWS